MKRFLHLSLFMVALFSMMSCSSGTPGGAAKKYAEYFKDGKYEKFVDGIAMKKKENVDATQMKEQKEGLVAMLKEKASKELAKKDGIKKVDIVSETISEDGNTATVVLKQTYGNGEEEDQTYHMVKDDGDWKMNISK